MKTILVGNQKGGVSKTGTCKSLIAAAVRDGHRVMAVDLDRQRTLANWAEASDLDFTLMVAQPHQIGALVASRSSDFDYLIIDTPPYASEYMPELSDHVDLVLVPLQASVDDFEGTKPTYAAVKSKNFAFVLTKNAPNSAAARELMPQLARYGRVAPELPERVAYRYLRPGQSIFDSPDAKAQDEVEQLWEYVKEIA